MESRPVGPVAPADGRLPQTDEKNARAMARANCRCGQPLNVPENGSERVVCPSCGAKVRVRKSKPKATAAPVVEDGYIRFFCPCGRRLKVNAADPPPSGRCPDCGTVVPVPDQAANGTPPALPPGHPETPTAELAAADLATLERWTRDHLARAANAGSSPSTSHLSGPPPMPEHPARAEAGLRVCPQCGRPVHLSAETCRACGAGVPRR
jgi:hypothetical protein